MHPKALLDACADLVRLTLKFDHPADAVVSHYFRDNRSLGPRERAASFISFTFIRRNFPVLRMEPDPKSPPRSQPSSPEPALCFKGERRWPRSLGAATGSR